MTDVWIHLNACEGDFGGFPREIPLKSVPSCSRRDLLHDLYGPSNSFNLFPSISPVPLLRTQYCYVWY